MDLGTLTLVRSYDLSVKYARDKDDPIARAFLKQGESMFLFCVSGNLRN